jgi:hypothetical protein
VLKISLEGKCKGFKVIPADGFPSRCAVQVELGHEIPIAFPVYNIELSIPPDSPPCWKSVGL